KGPIDIISNGQETKLNDIHNESMTVGGTGDVLAGIIGALLSKGVEPFNAARAGIFINGAAGNLAFKKHSYGLIATDLIEEIPEVLKKYL
ncbi:MAG: bifunctional ADP-dependent NAD(P)H-hydrate dehydratase/NAD(P)H-hydrate epimerase, partial [Thermoplasmatales archaeon]|nr:bifunctional ADP-dependent NAD(P)H-hydrate dehydratase/NAD(P)H-hydrate epimerase [Thermoplasmatales archaeon]